MTVLVVIRDAAVRRTVARLVRRGGLGAIAVRDFAHARLLLLGSSLAADALVTDRAPHDRDACACARALLRRDPAREADRAIT